MSVIKLETSLEKKRETKKKREAKFLEIHEIRAFFETLSQRRNPNYYDLVIVLLFSGLRIGKLLLQRKILMLREVYYILIRLCNIMI